VSRWNGRKRVFFDSFFVVRLWLNDTSYTAEVSEGTNRNIPGRNTLVQLLALYTNPESQNAQRDRQTDRQQDYANSRSHCVAVRSANKTEIWWSICDASSS